MGSKASHYFAEDILIKPSAFFYIPWSQLHGPSIARKPSSREPSGLLMQPNFKYSRKARYSAFFMRLFGLRLSSRFGKNNFTHIISQGIMPLLRPLTMHLFPFP